MREALFGGSTLDVGTGRRRRKHAPGRCSQAVPAKINSLQPQY